MEKRRATIKPIKEKAGAVHPDPPYGIDGALPPHEFSMLVIAPRGSGKTTLILNFLNEFFKGYFHRCHVFSPTMAGDAKWESVKQQRGILAYNKNRDKIDNPKSNGKGKDKDDSDSDSSEEDVKTTRENGFQYSYRNAWGNLFAPVGGPRYQIGASADMPPAGAAGAPPQDKAKRKKKPKEWTGRLVKKHMHANYDETDLQKVMDDQMKEIRILKKQGLTKHAADRQLLIFDDLVGSSLFSAKKDNPFTRLNTTMRHYSTSAMMVTQAYKAVPKVVRVNASVVVLFSIANRAELEAIYEENSAGLTKETWLEIYKECTSEPFSFMTLNYMRPRGHRVFLRFEEEIATPEETVDTGEIMRRKAGTTLPEEKPEKDELPAEKPIESDSE